MIDERSVQRLKEQVEILTKKLEARAVDSEQDRFQTIQKELNELKSKYIFLLENIVTLQSQRNWNIPTAVSKPKSETNLGDLQVLMLLKESKAISREYAVTAHQLKKAYGINKSERTVRNKLNYLESHNCVASIGKKPKAYFITPSGLTLLNEQKRTIISSNENIL